MSAIQRTGYGVYLQNALYLNQPVTIPAFTSMNEKLSINTNVTIASQDRPSISYFGIGLGGHSLTPGAGNIPVTNRIPHRSTDSALYNQIPFVLRPVTNDLTLAEMAKYRLRKVVTYGGVSYVAYYLKMIDFTNSQTVMNYNAVSNGVTTVTPFIASVNNMNPTPPVVDANGVVQTTGDFISVLAAIPFTLTATDITEILNACTIIFGNSNVATISEIAVCSGVDKPVPLVIGNVTNNITEAIGVQVTAFVNSAIPLPFINTSITLNFDLGSSEPLLV